MMKKVLIVLLVTILMLFISGCKDEKELFKVYIDGREDMVAYSGFENSMEIKSDLDIKSVNVLNGYLDEKEDGTFIYYNILNSEDELLIILKDGEKEIVKKKKIVITDSPDYSLIINSLKTSRVVAEESNIITITSKYSLSYIISENGVLVKNGSSYEYVLDGNYLEDTLEIGLISSDGSLIKYDKRIEAYENIEKSEIGLKFNGVETNIVYRGSNNRIEFELEDGDTINYIKSANQEIVDFNTKYEYRVDEVGEDILEIGAVIGGEEKVFYENIEILEEKEITFILYMAADNNLNGSGNESGYSKDYDFALKDLEEIRTSNVDSSKINVVILSDFLHNESDTPGYFVKSGDILCKTEISEFNTGSSYNMEELLNRVKDEFPARRYILDIWGHGDGWRDDGRLNNIQRSIAVDYSDGHDSLDLWELEDAIVSSKIGKMDIIYMDACDMNGIETVYQLKESADYIAASPMATPGDGGDYFKMLESISRKTEESTKELAIEIQSVNFKSYLPGGKQALSIPEQWGVIYSVDEQSRVEELKNSLDYFINIYLSNRAILSNNVNGLQRYAYINVDLGEFLKKALREEDRELYGSLFEARDEVLKNLEEYIVHLESQDQYDYWGNELHKTIYTKTMGLSIYFDEKLYQKDEYRRASRFGADGKWLEFLENMIIEE